MKRVEAGSFTPRPVSARSTILTLMLAGDEPTLSARDILAVTGAVGVSEATARVALSRLTSAGDVIRHADGFTLSDRLLARRIQQRRLLDPATITWHGDWELAVVTTSRRAAAERATHRDQLTSLGLAELREGVWMRPANLARPWPQSATAFVRRLSAGPVDDAWELAHSLWHLDEWHAHGRLLLAAISSAEEPAARFAACVASVRHLMTDPTLPAQLRPDDWPAEALRASYQDYRSWLFSLRLGTLTEEDHPGSDE